MRTPEAQPRLCPQPPSPASSTLLSRERPSSSCTSELAQSNCPRGVTPSRRVPDPAVIAKVSSNPNHVDSVIPRTGKETGEKRPLHAFVPGPSHPAPAKPCWGCRAAALGRRGRDAGPGTREGTEPCGSCFPPKVSP